MIIPQWLDLSLSRKQFHGPKEVRAIEIRLHVFFFFFFFFFFTNGSSKAAVLEMVGLCVVL